MILLLPLILLGAFVLVILLAPLFPVLFVAGLVMSGLGGIHRKQVGHAPSA